ncbi:MAG: helix-turn-helix domain-containing protein [Ilumatobacteraceae bacterium]
MIYPPYAAPFPDTKSAEITLGAQQRAMLTVFAQRPGQVVTPEDLAAKLNLPLMTPRRAATLISGLNDVLGKDTIIEVPRRGWKMSPYLDQPITITF